MDVVVRVLEGEDQGAALVGGVFHAFWEVVFENGVYEGVSSDTTNLS